VELFGNGQGLALIDGVGVLGEVLAEVDVRLLDVRAQVLEGVAHGAGVEVGAAHHEDVRRPAGRQVRVQAGGAGAEVRPLPRDPDVRVRLLEGIDEVLLHVDASGLLVNRHTQVCLGAGAALYTADGGQSGGGRGGLEQAAAIE